MTNFFYFFTLLSKWIDENVKFFFHGLFICFCMFLTHWIVFSVLNNFSCSWLAFVNMQVICVEDCAKNRAHINKFMAVQLEISKNKTSFSRTRRIYFVGWETENIIFLLMFFCVWEGVRSRAQSNFFWTFIDVLFIIVPNVQVSRRIE